MKTVFFFVILILAIATVIVAGLYFLSPGSLQSIWVYLNNLNLEFLANFFKQSTIYLLAPLFLDLLAILLAKLDRVA